MRVVDLSLQPVHGKGSNGGAMNRRPLCFSLHSAGDFVNPELIIDSALFLRQGMVAETFGNCGHDPEAQWLIW